MTPSVTEHMYIYVHTPGGSCMGCIYRCKTNCETYRAYWQCHTYAYLKL